MVKNFLLPLLFFGLCASAQIQPIGVATNVVFAHGDIPFWSGSEWILLNKGTNGQVLTTVGTNVAWATPAPSSGSGTGLVTSVSTDFRVSGGELSLTNTLGTGPMVRQSVANSGTVTSVSGASTVSGLGFSGPPVTSSGTLTLTGIVAEASISLEIPRLSSVNTYTATSNILTGDLHVQGSIFTPELTADLFNVGTFVLGTNVIGLANGGTSATNAAGARAALGTDNADNITSGTLADARAASTLARDSEVTAAIAAAVSDAAYSASVWNGDTGAASKNALRDKFELVTGALGANVKDFGAVGDGVTDDTTAVQAACTNSVVFFPAGTYLVNAVTLTNGLFFGMGPQSVIKAHTNFTSGSLISTRSNLVVIRDLRIDGNDTTNYASASTIGARTGLQLWAGGQSVATRLQVANWSGSGIFFGGLNDTAGRPNRAEVSFNSITNCQRGIWAGDTNVSEYCVVIGNQISRCYIGGKVDSANVLFSQNNVSDNLYGWHAYPLNGRSHSSFIGNTANHTTVFFQNSLSGALVLGNSFMGSTAIVLNSPTVGVFVTGNFCESSTITCYSETNVVSGNIMFTPFAFAGTRRPVLKNNFLRTGQGLSENLVVQATASITNDARYASSFTITLTNSPTLYPPTSANHGQRFDWSFLQDPTGTRTVTLTNFTMPTGLTLTVDTNAGKWSILEGYYSTNTGKIHVTESRGGF